MKEDTQLLLELRADQEKAEREAYAAETQESQDRYHYAAQTLGFEPKEENEK
jgi:hypothetical protein